MEFKKTRTAQRWLINHCENLLVEKKDSEGKIVETTKEPQVIETFQVDMKLPRNMVIPITLKKYRLKNSETLVREFIQGYRFFGKNQLKVYLALKFEGEKKNQKVICSLFGYQHTIKEEQKVEQ